MIGIRFEKLVAGSYRVYSKRSKKILGEVRRKTGDLWEWKPYGSGWSIFSWPTREKATEKVLEHIKMYYPTRHL